MAVNAPVGLRISMLRTLLIMFVVFLHLGGPPIAELDYGDPLALIRFFFQDVLGRLAVPTLSVVAGYLLFSANSDLSPLKLYKNKIRTLVVPFLVFNVLYFDVQYGIEYTTGWAPLFMLVDQPTEQLIDYVTSYKTTPINVALHFLRDLIVLVVFAPLFGYFLRRHAVIGLGLVIGIFMNDLDQHLVNRNTMPVLFYIGGLAAVTKFDLTKFDHLAKYALALLLAVCLVTMYLHLDDYTYVYLTAPFAVWPASSLLVGTRVGYWLVDKAKYSFFLFLSHSPLIRLAELVHSKFFPGVPNNAYIAVTFVVVVTISVMIYDLASMLIPTTFAFLTGGRSQRRASGNDAIAGVTAR